MKKAYRGLLTFLSIAVLVVGLAMCGQVSAQIISGDLVGTILDKTGAVVPGARVEVTKTDTGVKYETVPIGYDVVPIGVALMERFSDFASARKTRNQKSRAMRSSFSYPARFPSACTQCRA